MKKKILGLIAGIITASTAITGCGAGGGCSTWGFMRNNSSGSEMKDSSTQNMEKSSMSNNMTDSSMNNK